jgi:hypothetical protein
MVVPPAKGSNPCWEATIAGDASHISTDATYIKMHTEKIRKKK